MGKRYTATYEVEIQTPLHDVDGNLYHLDVGANLIEEIGEITSSGAGFGLRDVEGEVNFDSPEAALEWKARVIEQLQEEYPEDQYPEHRPEVFVGFRLCEGDGEDFYVELLCLGGEYYAQGDDDDQAPISVDEIDIQTVEPYPDSMKQAMSQASLIEQEAIQTHHKSLG